LDNINKISKELKDISNMPNSKISENILDEDYDNKTINTLDNTHMETRNKNLDSSSKNKLNNAFENLNLDVTNSNSICTISVSKRRSKSISTYRSVGNLSNESNNSSLNERSKLLNTYRSMGNLSSESNNSSLNEKRSKSLNTYKSVGNLSSESNNSSLNEKRIHSSCPNQSPNHRKSKSLANSFASLNNLSNCMESQDGKKNIINSNQFKGFVITNDMMKPEFGVSRIAKTDSTISHLNQFSENESLHLASNENETLDFTFSSHIGPMMGTIRALDIKVLPSTNQVIGVSASGDDRGDKKISLWDLNNSSIITQLNNKTSKTVLTLSFHPVWEDILLSSDMEFDVKLWNWKTGKLLKIWKKHHTRIIHKTEFIPDNYEMAVSCSSDQSIKIWNVTKDDSKMTSIHSNEPFTSFTFYGKGHNQILVASLNYSLKLYKLRTSSFLHSIILEDLKSNKTPITSITSHPIQDNFILISSDNRLILFDLKTSTSLKTYCSREILPGQRIQGDFSPCGNYIYSGCADVKSFDSRKLHNLASTNSISNANLMNLNNDDDCIDNSERDLNNVSGVFIWKLNTGKLERNSMSLMEESAFYKDIGIYPVTLCKWITINNISTTNDNNDNNENNKRKILISAGLDRCINVFSG
jgi:WD40 repeat protein